MNQHLRKQEPKGFTIIEIMVVVVVIAILAVVSVMAYNGVTSSAKKTAFAANLKAYTDAYKVTSLSTIGGGSISYNCLGDPKSYPAHGRFTEGACMLMGPDHDPIDSYTPEFIQKAVKGGPIVFDTTEEAVIEAGGPVYAIVGIRGAAILSLENSSPDSIFVDYRTVIIYPSKPFGCVEGDIIAADLPNTNPVSSFGHLVVFQDAVCVKQLNEKN